MRRARSFAPALALGALLLTTACAPELLSDTSRETTTEASGTPSPGALGSPGSEGEPTEESPPRPTRQPAPGPTQEPGTATGSVKVLDDAVATDIPIPWGLAELPDGTVVVSSRDEHHLYRVAPRSGDVVDLGEVAGVDSDGGEGGLLGVAVSKYFTSNKRIFLYYSTPTDNRIGYVTLRPGSPATISRPTVVFSGIPRGFRHNGGRIAFGPDGMLYVGTGENEVPELAQDLESLAGKILRITPQGKPAPGNPFGRSAVYSYGHRNVQGLAFDAEGRVFASELGDQAADELNWIQPGNNYGWPDSEGASDVDGFTDPIAQFGTDEDSPSGIALAGGSVYMAALQGERLWRIPLDGTDLVAEPEPFLVGELGRLRSVIAVSRRKLLVTTSNADGRVAPRPGDDRLVLLRVR